MEELHVLIESNSAYFLDAHLDVKVVTLFEENRRVIYWNTVVDRVNSHIVFVNLRLDIMGNIIIYRVTHVLGQNVSESLVVDLVIVKYFDHANQISGLFRGIETYFENLVLVLML